MSGVIVERRDQVLMTCGRWPPARIRSTILRMPLSIQGPFLTERGINYFQFLIADCRFKNLLQLQEPFGNRQLQSTMSLHSSIANNHLLRPLVMTRLVAARRLTPGCHRITAAGSFSFTTTV